MKFPRAPITKGFSGFHLRKNADHQAQGTHGNVINSPFTGNKAPFFNQTTSVFLSRPVQQSIQRKIAVNHSQGIHRPGINPPGFLVGDRTPFFNRTTSAFPSRSSQQNIQRKIAPTLQNHIQQTGLDCVRKPSLQPFNIRNNGAVQPKMNTTAVVSSLLKADPMQSIVNNGHPLQLGTLQLAEGGGRRSRSPSPNRKRAHPPRCRSGSSPSRDAESDSGEQHEGGSPSERSGRPKKKNRREPIGSIAGIASGRRSASGGGESSVSGGMRGGFAGRGEASGSSGMSGSFAGRGEASGSGGGGSAAGGGKRAGQRRVGERKQYSGQPMQTDAMIKRDEKIESKRNFKRRMMAGRNKKELVDKVKDRLSQADNPHQAAEILIEHLTEVFASKVEKTAMEFEYPGQKERHKRLQDESDIKVKKYPNKVRLIKAGLKGDIVHEKMEHYINKNFKDGIALKGGTQLHVDPESEWSQGNEYQEFKVQGNAGSQQRKNYETGSSVFDVLIYSGTKLKQGDGPKPEEGRTFLAIRDWKTEELSNLKPTITMTKEKYDKYHKITEAMEIEGQELEAIHMNAVKNPHLPKKLRIEVK